MSKSVMVVAHPDDETLFGAVALTLMPGEWTVICCSIPRIDPIRAWKFFDACDVFGAKGRLIPITETEPSERLNGLEMLDLSEFDQIVTHGEAGEYGHVHHKHVHQFVTGRWAHKPIKCFANKGEAGSKEIRLDGFAAEKKKEALRRYDHCLPYGGRVIPKWQALLERYADRDPMTTEVYRDLH